MASKQELKEMNDIWQMVMESFHDTMATSTVKLWFEPLLLESYENNTVTFSTDSELKYNIITEKHLGLMKQGFSNILGFPVEVELILSKTPAEDTEPPYVSPFIQQPEVRYNTDEKPVERVAPKFREAVEFGSETLPFHFEYTFENFIVGSSNTFAHAACLAIANNPAFLENNPDVANEINSPYNPLFIYGPSGLGKTHLLHAVVNRIREKNSYAKILYIKGDDFTNQLIEHLAKGTMAEFKEKYRKCDVLLIDDIQFIAGKASTQEEFFHTFNALHEDNKQIILTSDRPPHDIKPLEERLVTRFEWGLIADIQPPDLELRVAIIKKKAEIVGITLPKDVLEFLAENLRSNIRQIEGAVKKLGAQAFLSGREINIELAKSCIIELMGGDEPVAITVDKVFAAIKRHYNVSREEIMSQNRKKEIAAARHVFVYVLRKLTDMSFHNIAGVINKKDHSTCINSYQTIEKILADNPAFQTEISALIKEISGN